MKQEDIIKALEELKKDKERKFNQSIDLIINLKNFDVKKDSVNLFLELPHKVRDVKIAAFLTKKNPLIDTITKSEFASYEKSPKEIKKLIKEHDFFVSSASLMPLVAKSFGRFLGQAGKMPSPQLGILKQETDVEIKSILNKFEKVIRIKSKEPSLKFIVGKKDMKTEDVAENIIRAHDSILNALPRKKENLKSVLIKLTMGKPLKIE